jgi:glyoxylase-like metal-dependent hydrolase (beta-lactamase superfamily II)
MNIRAIVPALGASAVAAAVIAMPVRLASQAPQQPARIMSLSTFANLFVVLGDGTNSVALGGDDGVVLIDTKVPGWGKTMADKIELGTESPITTIINTSVHMSGSNPEIPTVREIIAHENTKAHMAALDTFKGAGAKFLPNRTFKDTLSLQFKTRGEKEGTNRVDLYYFGRARTDGDVVVVLPSFGIALMGELFPAKAAPAIDTARGGSAVALPETLDKAVATLAKIKDLTIVIPGRGAAPNTPYVMSWMTLKDVQEYAAFTRELVGSVRASLQAGESVDGAVRSLKVADKYKGYTLDQVRQTVQAIYHELKK